MKKPKYSFECDACGRTYNKWAGKCMSCGEWNSIVEIKQSEININQVRDLSVDIYNLNNIDIPNQSRLKTGSEEFDRILGGGIVKDSAVLLGGEPGIGKSTLLLELINSVSKVEQALYVSGEESASQLKLRAERLGINNNNINIVVENDLELILSAIYKIKPSLLILDSIQSIYDKSLNSPLNSFSQLRHVTSTIVNLCKAQSIAVFLIGHVNKEGNIAGPKLIEHMVDVVVYFDGDSNNDYRILRTIKNRFGATNEIGLFEMSSSGLKDVPNPSLFFMTENRSIEVGSTISCLFTGNRPILLELQSLLSTAYTAIPRRTVVGYETNRVAMLLAIMDKHFNYNFSNLDLFINIAGGLKTKDPALDLAIIFSIASSYLVKKMKDIFVIIGELSLTGKVRPSSKVNDRIKEASRLGFKNFIISGAEDLAIDKKHKGVKIYNINSIEEGFDIVF